jgi:hypothetical protein
VLQLTHPQVLNAATSSAGCALQTITVYVAMGTQLIKEDASIIQRGWSDDELPAEQPL